MIVHTPTIGTPTIGVCFTGDHRTDRTTVGDARRPARAGPAGVLRGGGRRPQHRRVVPPDSGADGPDPPPVPGDAGPVAERAAVGQTALRAAPARPGDAFPAAQAPR